MPYSLLLSQDLAHILSTQQVQQTFVGHPAFIFEADYGSPLFSKGKEVGVLKPVL